MNQDDFRSVSEIEKSYLVRWGRERKFVLIGSLFLSHAEFEKKVYTIGSHLRVVD